MLLAQVVSLVGPNATGPEMFLTTVFQVSFMTASLVRSMCNEIVGLKLKSLPGENVAKLGEMITDKVKQIECSGSVPDDLMFLVTKPYTTGTQETFRTFAQQVYTSVVDGAFKGTYIDVVHKMNNFYQNLVQSDDYEPAKGGKKDTDTSILQGMISRFSSQMDKLQVSKSGGGSSSTGGSGNNGKSRKCFKCGSEDHLLKDCPQKDQQGSQSSGNKLPPIDEWRKKKPATGESHTKTVEGKIYKWCDKCLKGTGLWTVGSKSHLTAGHKTWKERKAEKAAKAETGNLATLPESPLEVHFG